jgi:ATP-binding cassette subfamily C (CFTR/MRP) protein 1
LDDPLSALDAGTAKEVFTRLIKSDTAFFANTAVLLVTHASHFLNRVDRLVVVVDGSLKYIGTWEDLVVFDTEDSKTQGVIDFIRASVQEEHNIETESVVASSAQDIGVDHCNAKPVAHTLMTIEDREHGLSSLKTWMLWFRYAGRFYFVGGLIIFMILDRIAYVAMEYWIARWTQGAHKPVDVFGHEFPAQTAGRSSQYKYLR